MEPDLALFQRVAVVVLNLTVSVLVGAGAALLWLRGAASPWAVGMLLRLRKAMLLCFGTAALSYVLVLWLEAASMAEVPVSEAFPAVASVITATHYGSAWMIGACALLLAWAATAIRARTAVGRPGPVMQLIALGLFLYSRSIVSHAGAAGNFTWMVALDWVHLVLVSTWVGAVVVAGLITMRNMPGTGRQDSEECARYVEALSTSATIALAGILVTGVLSAWRALGSPGQIFGNPYGTVLLAKVALLVCAAALGGLNRFVLMPALLSRLRGTGLRESGGARRFASVLQLEAIILVTVMIAAAILSATPPPTAS